MPENNPLFPPINVAIVGASGEVGSMLTRLLDEREFPVSNLYLLGSQRSAGRTVKFNRLDHTIELLSEFDFSKVKVAFFAAGGEVSKEYAPKAVEAGAVVIDKSSVFRQVEQCPLVVPEVNGHLLDNLKGPTLIASPNCSTIQMVVTLKPLDEAFGLQSVEVSTYQSVSGAGKSGVSELAESTASYLNGSKFNPETFDAPIGFNVLARIGAAKEDGYTDEEVKMIVESRRILERKDLPIVPTCVRVPVFYGHSETLSIITQSPCTVEEIREVLGRCEGVSVLDDIEHLQYANPREHGTDLDDVFVSRIRKHPNSRYGTVMWVVSDNIRKGAATNAIQIAERLFLSQQSTQSKQIP